MPLASPWILHSRFARSSRTLPRTMRQQLEEAPQARRALVRHRRRKNPWSLRLMQCRLEAITEASDSPLDRGAGNALRARTAPQMQPTLPRPEPVDMVDAQNPATPRTGIGQQQQSTSKSLSSQARSSLLSLHLPTLPLARSLTEAALPPSEASRGAAISPAPDRRTGALQKATCTLPSVTPPSRAGRTDHRAVRPCGLFNVAAIPAARNFAIRLISFTGTGLANEK